MTKAQAIAKAKDLGLSIDEKMTVVEIEKIINDFEVEKSKKIVSSTRYQLPFSVIDNVKEAGVIAKYVTSETKFDKITNIEFLKEREIKGFPKNQDFFKSLIDNTKDSKLISVTMKITHKDGVDNYTVNNIQLAGMVNDKFFKKETNGWVFAGTTCKFSGGCFSVDL
jgi:hypothetical protein